MIKTLLRQLGKYKRESLLAPLFTVGEVLMEVLIPFVIARLIDLGIEAENVRAVWTYGGLMLVLSFISLGFGVLSGRFSATASTGFAANLRAAMYRKIQTYSFSNIDRFSTASLVTRMTTDVTNLQNAWHMLIRIAVRTPVMMLLSIVMCVLTSPSLSTIFLVAIVFLGAVLATIIVFATKTFSRAFKKYDDLNAGVEENVAGVRVVKAYVREEYEKEKFGKAVGDMKNLFVGAEGFLAFNRPVMMSVIYGCIIALSWFGAKQVVGGQLSTGSLTSMFTYVMNILMSLMMLSIVFVMLSMSAASAGRIAEVLSETPDIQNPENPLTEVKNGEIEFRDVTFFYAAGSGDPVLKNISLSIRSGETIGIIGATGAGKSTLVSLLSRLYDAQSGSVFVGGQDVRRYDLTVLRNSVSVVLQKNVLFSGTVLENLRWGNAAATEEECREACRLAQIDEFIMQLPEGYESHVEQGGSNFSGGQKQRLCIARALLKSPKILVLDDSTSAVDTATDAMIRASFRKVIPQTTKIIIAQRINSVQDADRILVLDDGRISGFDTHENLLASSAVYKEIYETQTGGGGDFDAPEA